jgi:hypothetical protein
MIGKSDLTIQKKKEESEAKARNKLAEKFEGMGAKIAGWLLREGYSTETVASVATAEIGEQKVYEAGGYCVGEAAKSEKLIPNDYDDALLNLGYSIQFGALHGRPSEAEELLNHFREECHKAKELSQASH